MRFLGCRGSFRKRVRIVGLGNTDCLAHAKVKLSNFTNGQPSTSLTVTTGLATLKGIGAVTYVPFTQGGCEFQIGQYMSNHFYTTSTSGDPVANSDGSWTDPTFARGYQFSVEYNGAPAATFYCQEETAAGDDFSFGFFIGGVPYDF